MVPRDSFHGQEAHVHPSSSSKAAQVSTFVLEDLFCINALELHTSNTAPEQHFGPLFVSKSSMQMSEFFGSGQREINGTGISCCVESSFCLFVLSYRPLIQCLSICTR